jgi:hypothetical protein
LAKSVKETAMTLKDKLEIGLKEDAPYRKDNLPDQQVRGPEVPAGEDRSPVIPAARGDVNKTGNSGDQAEPASVPFEDDEDPPADDTRAAKAGPAKPS